LRLRREADYFGVLPDIPALPDSELPLVVPVVALGADAAPSLVAAGELAGEVGSVDAAGGGGAGVLGLVVLGVVVVLADLSSSLPQPVSAAATSVTAIACFNMSSSPFSSE
jgi:hypothetical protein